MPRRPPWSPGRRTSSAADIAARGAHRAALSGGRRHFSTVSGHVLPIKAPTNKCLAESNKSRTAAKRLRSVQPGNRLDHRIADSLGDKMTKPKMAVDLARSLDEDWPPRQPITIADLVAEARSAHWDFADWCYASGYDAGDPTARHMFECLLVYARGEGRAGLH
jgi:hypothetical protein